MNTPDPNLDDHAAAITAEMVRKAEGLAAAITAASPGLSMDFTPGSLADLDGMAELHRLETLPQAPEAERQPLLLGLGHALGAYFGETIRRSLGGRWFSPDGTTAMLAVQAGGKEVRVSPLVRACKRLIQGDEDSFAALYDYLAAAVQPSTAPETSPDVQRPAR